LRIQVVCFGDIRQNRADAGGAVKDGAVSVVYSQNLLTSMLNKMFKLADFVAAQQGIVVFTEFFESELRFAMGTVGEH